jgi:cell division protein ZapA (FtsZ GTPase activity inhibitor)
MIVKSSNKKITENININITNKDGTIYCLERKDHIKYLGVLIDEELSWKYHIAYICSRLARNIGIF